MKKEDLIIAGLSILSVLVIVNIMATFYGSGIRNVTGSVVEESVVDVNTELAKDIDNLKKENDALKKKNEEINEKIDDLQKTIENINKEQEIKKEVCSVTCGKDEICIPVNKADGNVKWQCVTDPDTVLGS